ncbi:MAG: sulfotransferase [Xenococcaceae cyanobacterium MO_207.B15]|nr:sulfotransferase [Xenococcaceae cyanobacterium MO_207.B15]
MTTPPPRLLHPLMGCNLKTLIKLLATNGFVAPNRLPQLGLILAATLSRLPFSLAERILVAQSSKSLKSPPVFIVGHWRSGTTYLYNLLSRDPALATVSPLATGLPWDFLLLAKLIQPLLEKALPSDRKIDQVPVNPDSPQEDEIALANMQSVSFYHGLYFPQRFRANFNAGIFFTGCSPQEVEQWQKAMTYFLTKLQLQHPDRRLLIKNPVYTARVGLLGKLFPDAKFIHIYRNPYIVFQSMRNFYRTLLAEMTLQPYHHVAIDEVILESYLQIMNTLFEDRAKLDQDPFVEVRFEDLKVDPLSQVELIYQQLDLDNFAAAKPYFNQYLNSLSPYRQNRYQFTALDNQKVEKYWQPFIKHWQYQPPV